MDGVGLNLANHKTEAVLFTSRKQVENITLDVGQCIITYRPCIRYLGVMLDTRLSFKPHVEHDAVKAAKVAKALARLMPNIGEPQQPRWKLLASVVIFILTYGIAIWRKPSRSRNVDGRSQLSTGSAALEYPALPLRFLTRPCVLSQE